MRTAILTCTLLLLAGLAAPVAATIYLPYTTDQIDGDVRLTTRLWVSNPNSEPHRFSALFVEANTDGSAPRGELPKTNVPPGMTMLVDPAIPVGSTGYLELTGAPQLRYSARLEVYDLQGNLIQSSVVPLIGSTETLEAGESTQLQGLERGALGRTSNLGLVNFGDEPAQCELGFFLSNGDRITNNALLTVQPFSMRLFDDALSLIGLVGVRDVRFSVSCDQEFYAFTRVFGPDPENTVFHGPAHVGTSLLVPPGVAPEGQVDFRVPGVFLDARPGDSRIAFNFDLPVGVVYDSVTIKFDFTFGGFQSNLFHTLSSLRGDGLWYAATMRGTPNKTLIDTALGERNFNSSWTRNRTYQIEMIYDAAANQFRFNVRLGGSLIQAISVTGGRNDLLNPGGRNFVLDFSQDRVFDNAFFPLFGSRFANLEVLWEPAR